MMRLVASITGVLVMPTGLTCPQPAPLCCGALPMLFVHRMAPVVSSSAYTLLLVETAKNAPLLLGPLLMYSGEAHMLPVNFAANAVSAVSMGTAALVSL